MNKKLVLSATAILMLTMTGSNQVFANETSIIDTHMAVTQRNQTIELMGLNGEFAQVSLNKGETQGKLKTFSNGNQAVHNYYGDSIYTTISIKDKNKKEVYDKKFTGKQQLADATENLPLTEGSTIEIYHAEAHRVGASEEALKQKWDTNHFRYIVKNGQLEAVPSVTQSIDLCGLNGEFAQVSFVEGETQGKLKTFWNGNLAVHNYYGDTIYSTISIKDKNKKEVYNKNFTGNQLLTDATENLPLAEGSMVDLYHAEAHRVGASEESLKQKWGTTHFRYVVKNGKLEAVPSVTQSIDLCGLNGEFAQVSFIEGKTQGELKTFWNGNLAVHNYYGNSIYTSISVKDKNKKEVYNKSFTGNQLLTDAPENLPLVEGNMIDIYHAEAHRVGANEDALKQKWDATHFKYVVENGKLIPYKDVPATFESFADDATLPSIMAPTDKNLRMSIINAFNPMIGVTDTEHFVKQYYYILGGLDLSHLKFAKKGIHDLQGIQYLDRISSLNLSYNDSIKDYSPLATRKMSTLNSLTGNYLRMTNEQLSFMEKAKTYLPNLGYMDFNHNQITDLSSLKDITSRLGQKFEGEFKNQEIILSDPYYTDGPLYKIDNPLKDYQGNPVAPNTINNGGIYNSETNTIEWNLPQGHTALRFTWNEEWYYSPCDDQSDDNTPAINFSGNYTRYANIR